MFDGFPKFGVPFWGVPIIRSIVLWGSILGSPYLGKLPFCRLPEKLESSPQALTGLGFGIQIEAWDLMLICRAAGARKSLRDLWQKKQSQKRSEDQIT